MKGCSWPGWLTFSGWFTHLSGHPSATGREQDSESKPAKVRRYTAGPRNQIVVSRLLLWPPYVIGGHYILIVSLVWGTPWQRLGSVTARHSSSGRQPNCGVQQKAPPIFGRAAIALSIGPHF